MALNKEFWAKKRASAALTEGVKTITFDQCVDAVINYINNDYTSRGEVLLSSESAKAYNSISKLIHNYVATYAPIVEGFVANGVMQGIKLTQALSDALLGWDVLEIARTDPTIREIQINDWKTIYVERKGEKYRVLYRNPLTDEPVCFQSPESYRKFAENLLKFDNVKFSENEALVTAVSVDGYRLALIHEGATPAEWGVNRLADKTPSCVIRKTNIELLTLNDFIKFQSIPTEMAKDLQTFIQVKMSILVGGGTSAGKTSVLQAIIMERPSTMRYVIVEDTAEIQGRRRDEQGIDQGNTVQIVTKPAYGKESPTYPTTANAITQSLRLSPDNIIVGESRADEVLVQVAKASNTGHGAFTTVHTETPGGAVRRFADALQTLNPARPYGNIIDQLCEDFHLVITGKRLGNGQRKITGLYELVCAEVVDGIVRPKVRPIYVFERGKTPSAPGRHVRVGNYSERLKDMVWDAQIDDEDAVSRILVDVDVSTPIECTYTPIELKGV